MLKSASTALLVLFMFTMMSRADELEERVMAPSVRILAGNDAGGKYLGSGTLFIADRDWYAITAGHVLQKARKIVEVEITNAKGSIEKKKKAVWEDIYITRPIYQDNEDVGEVRIRAKVIAYSPPEEDAGVDMAVLQVPNTEIFKNGARWGDSSKKLKVAQDIVHVGNLYGSITKAFCKGNIARLDHSIPELNTKFAVVPMGGARPGSSGGGVFLLDNSEYIFVGMITRGDNGGLTLMKTSAQVADFLTENKLDKIMKAK